MTSNNVSVSEFMEMASFLYGTNWCVELSEKLGIRSELLVLTLGDGGTVPPDLSDILCGLVKAELGNIDDRFDPYIERLGFPLGRGDTSSRSTRRVRRLIAS